MMNRLSENQGLSSPMIAIALVSSPEFSTSTNFVQKPGTNWKCMFGNGCKVCI